VLASREEDVVVHPQAFSAHTWLSLPGLLRRRRVVRRRVVRRRLVRLLLLRWLRLLRWRRDSG